MHTKGTIAGAFLHNRALYHQYSFDAICTTTLYGHSNYNRTGCEQFHGPFSIPKSPDAGSVRTPISPRSGQDAALVMT